MLTLLLGTDWTANRNEILSRIARDVAQRQGNRILMVPELISHDTERRLAAAAGPTASRYAQVLSFTRLGWRVSDLVGRAFPPCLDDSGRIVAMASTARQLHSRLKTYASVETKPEFLSQVIDAVDEMKRCCIGCADLQAASAQAQGLLAQKLEELALLMEGYDALCAQGKRDPRDQMTWVLEQLEQTDFAENHVFYVDGFPDLTRQNLAILAHIIRVGAQITVSLNCDGLHSEAMAFEKAAQTATELYKIAVQANIPVHIETVAPRHDALQAMRALVFEGKIPENAPVRERIAAVRATSVYQECEVAAQKVMQLVQSGCRYRDIAVVCTQMPTYAPILRLIFDQCGLPLYITGMEEVLNSGVISTVIFALNAALGGWEQRDVLRYLRSALSPLDRDACDRMENYAVIWAISGKRWCEPWTGHPRGLSEPWDEFSRDELEKLNADRAAVMAPLMRLRDAFRAATKVADQVRALYAFLDDTAFCERLQTLAQSMEDDGDDRTAQIDHQLWDILLNALEQLYDVLGETTWDDDTFVRLLKLLLSRCSVGTIPPVLDAVSAGTVSTMRCQQAQHLVLLGANEGSLPGYGGSSGLLSDQERVHLRALGLPLTGGAMEGLAAEFAEIYGVFCGAEETVTVTASAAQPSFVFRRMAALSGGERAADTDLIAALRRETAAGAYLAACGARDEAAQLGISDAYETVTKRAAHRLGTVTGQNVRALYGERLRLSASQVDRQAECRLSYFLKYGLRVRERKEARVDPAEFGTYVHAVLEQTCRTVMERGGFQTVTLEQTLELANRFSDAYLQAHFQEIDSRRMEYLFRRNMQELDAVVHELWRELNAADYQPRFFELNFDENGQMPAVEIRGGAMPAQLRGFVDRVDVWENGDAAYFRVVDYKTGKKEFDYCDVCNGVGLQMLIYLFALEQKGGKLLPGRRVSAGVQYFPARVPYLSADATMTDEQAQKKRQPLWKRSGLLLADTASLHAMADDERMSMLGVSLKDGTPSGNVADRVQLEKLRGYMMSVLAHMVDDIACGNVEANPYTRGSAHDACTFCPYGTICHEDTVPGRRDYRAMSAEEFWKTVEKEAHHG